MRKYIKDANKPAYNTMLALNGGETYGERDRNAIDEYLGIAENAANTVIEDQQKGNKDLKGNKSL